MGYQSDLTTTNKSLLNAVNKHNDNYSALNLNQDLVLVTALISVFLQKTDFTDMELFSLNRKELCEMIELKRRLFETNIKLDDLQFKQELGIKRLDKYNRDDFDRAIEKFLGIVSEVVSPESLLQIQARTKEIFAELPIRE